MERLVKVIETITPEGCDVKIEVDGKIMARSASLDTLKILARVLGATVKHERCTIEEL